MWRLCGIIKYNYLFILIKLKHVLIVASVPTHAYYGLALSAVVSLLTSQSVMI